MQLFAAIPAMFTAGGTAAATAGSLGLMEAAAVGVPGVAATAALPSAAFAGTAAAGAGLGSTLALIGTGIDAVSGLMKGNEQADILEANAKIAEMEGRQKQEAAKVDTLKLSREARQAIGTQAALYGASGANIESGSPLEVMMQTASDYERSMIMRGYAGDFGAASSRFEGDIYRYGAAKKRSGAWINAGGTLLTGWGKSLLGKY